MCTGHVCYFKCARHIRPLADICIHEAAHKQQHGSSQVQTNRLASCGGLLWSHASNAQMTAVSMLLLTTGSICTVPDTPASCVTHLSAVHAMLVLL